MTDDLEKLSEWLTPLLNNLDTQQRRKLMQTVARDLRRRNQQRIRRQTDPDGKKWEKRKQQQGKIKRAAMFTKIRTARWLKINTNPDTAAIQWAGRIARIAEVHHYGKKDKVSKNGPEYDYPERRLIGFAREDHTAITDLIIKHLAEGL